LTGWWIQGSPSFRVSSFGIIGVQSLSKAEIVQQLGEIEGRHILLVMLNRPADRLLLHPRVKEARVAFHYPSHLQVEITERTPIALIPYYNHFLVVDEEGRVLDLLTSISSRTSSLPLVTGLNLPLLSVGETVTVTPNFLAAVRVILHLDPQVLLQTVEIDVSSALQVILRSSDNITIDVGEGHSLNGMSSNLLLLLEYLRGEQSFEGQILMEDGVFVYCAPPRVAEDTDANEMIEEAWQSEPEEDLSEEEDSDPGE